MYCARVCASRVWAFSWPGGAADACFPAAVRYVADAVARLCCGVSVACVWVQCCTIAVLCLVLDPPTHRLAHRLGAGRPGKEAGAWSSLVSTHSRQTGQARQARHNRHRLDPGKAAFPIPDIKTIICAVHLLSISSIYLPIPIPIPSQPMQAASFPTHTPPSRFLSILTSTLPAATPLLSPPLLTYFTCLCLPPLPRPTNQP